MAHLLAIGAALLGLATAAGATMSPPVADVSKGGAGTAPKPDARQTGESRAPTSRASARGSVSSIHHPRRRKGSGGADRTEPSSAEVVGGAGGHKSGKRRFAKTDKPGAARHRTARLLPSASKGPCLHEAVDFERGFGGDVQSLVLTRCDGRPAPHALEQLSVLVRPMSAPKPTVPTTPIRHGANQREWLPGIRLVHEGLVARLQQVVDHFGPKKITVVSGYRPSSLGSFHQSARAIDFHLNGVTNEALVAFCRTLDDTGCGYYPNSSFVHMDVRTPRTGHVYWIDASGPGEAARYVASWPPKDSSDRPLEIPRPDPAAPLDEHTHPDSELHLAPGASDAKVDARTTAPLSAGDGKDDPFAP